MQVYGIDFTSAPRAAKPIACAACRLEDGVLAVDALVGFAGFEPFENFLGSDGPWIAGCDFPFGQPRLLAERLGWPLDWAGFTARTATLGVRGFARLIEDYRVARAAGDRYHRREADRRAGSRSPMMIDYTPVGRMYAQGAPRLLASGATVVPCHPGDPSRVLVEAYPALVARRVIGRESYKSDVRARQTASREAARWRLVAALPEVTRAHFGLELALDPALAEVLAADPGADDLDAVLCAVQAAWAWTRREHGFGVPPGADPLEGWIADPAALEPPPPRRRARAQRAARAPAAPGNGPLAGVRVLDFSRVLAGPFCTALLADLGADVIKVESPAGDDYRRVGPFVRGESTYFMLVNRGKRGVALDLKRDTGRDLARRLAAECDVVVENFRPGVADRLGIGAERLCHLDPRLVYASVSGFGQDGPMAGRPAYDLIAQALSGIMENTGDPAGPPTLVGESVGDLGAGLYAAWAILAALFERERTGRGRRIDVAMFDALFTLSPTALATLLAGGVPGRVGNRHPQSTPFGVFAAADGHLAVAVLSDAQFQALAEVIGRPALARDPRFASDPLRTRNEPALRDAIESWSRRLPVDEAVSRLAGRGVPASPIWGTVEAARSEQVAHRRLLREAGHPDGGTVRLTEQPVHFGGLERGRAVTSPSLGQHTREVLREVLGLDDARVDALENEGVV